MKNVNKKQAFLLYVLLCVLAAAAVINFLALPMLEQAEEADSKADGYNEQYQSDYTDMNYAVGLKAETEDILAELNEGKGGAWVKEMSAGEADRRVSQAFRDNGFEVFSLEISDEMPYEEAFPETERDSSDKEKLSGVKAVKLTYGVTGKFGGFPGALKEISELEGCCVGDISADFVSSGNSGQLSENISGNVDVYMFLYGN